MQVDDRLRDPLHCHGRRAQPEGWTNVHEALGVELEGEEGPIEGVNPELTVPPRQVCLVEK